MVVRDFVRADRTIPVDSKFPLDNSIQALLDAGQTTTSACARSVSQTSRATSATTCRR